MNHIYNDNSYGEESYLFDKRILPALIIKGGVLI